MNTRRLQYAVVRRLLHAKTARQAQRHRYYAPWVMEIPKHCVRNSEIPLGCRRSTDQMAEEVLVDEASTSVAAALLHHPLRVWGRDSLSHAALALAKASIRLLRPISIDISFNEPEDT